MTRQWIIPPVSQESTALADRRGLPSLIAHILSNRGIHEEARIDGFLTPQLKDLHPPAMLPGATAAAELLVAAVRSKLTIVLYGDYDVDGTAGVAILWHALRQAGAEPRFYVPHRIEEGYGLNATAVRRLVEDGAEFIVAIDCGITAIDIAAELQTRGIPLLILDHHVLPAELPAAAAIVHPSIGGVPQSEPLRDRRGLQGRVGVCPADVRGGARGSGLSQPAAQGAVAPCRPGHHRRRGSADRGEPDHCTPWVAGPVRVGGSGHPRARSNLPA